VREAAVVEAFVAALVKEDMFKVFLKYWYAFEMLKNDL